jgi:trans-aconitate methyltransferase
MQENVYHTNYKLENDYWWFTSRNSIVLEVFKKYVKNTAHPIVMDVGCGTGGFAKLINEDYNLIALDNSPLALEYTQKRGIKNIFLGNLDDYPTEKKVDAMTFLDVIEHIEDDSGVIRTARNLLSDKGLIVATVPAYLWLWSKHDEMHMHYRRYTKTKFEELFKSGGFNILYSSYFNTFLFPLAASVRVLQKALGKGAGESAVDEVSPLSNKILNTIFSSERNFLPEMSFPFGLSIILVAQKK